MLRLQAEGCTARVRASGFTSDCIIQKIAAVELDPGWVVQTSITRPELGSYTWAASTGASRSAFQHEIVVVSVTQFQLFITLANAGADRRRAGKVQRCAFHTANFSSGDQRGIDGGESACM